MGRCGAARGGLGRVIVVEAEIRERAGQIQASDSGRDGGVEGELPCWHRGGGA